MSHPTEDFVTEQQRWKELGVRVRAGERQAFRSVFEWLYPEVVAYSASLGGGTRSAEDLAQDAFVRLWEKRKLIDPHRSIKALLFVTVRNLTFNSTRDANNRRILLETRNAEGEAAKDTAPERQIDESIDAAMLGTKIRRWIDDLPDREGEAFRLSRFSELKHREIADVMGISKHTVEKHITNALRTLRDRLKALDPGLLGQ